MDLWLRNNGLYGYFGSHAWINRIIPYKWTKKVQKTVHETKREKMKAILDVVLIACNGKFLYGKFNEIWLSDILTHISYSSLLNFNVGNVISVKYAEVNIENKLETPLSSICGLFNKNVPDNQQSFIRILAVNEIMCECNVLPHLYSFLLYILYHLPTKTHQVVWYQNGCTYIAACFDLLYISAKQIHDVHVARACVPRLDNNFMLPFLNLRAAKFGLGEYWLQT